MRCRTYVFADRDGVVRALYRAHPSGMGAAQAHNWAGLKALRLSYAAWTHEVRRKINADRKKVIEFHDHLSGKSRVF